MEEDDDDDDDEESEDEGSDEEVSHILATRHFVYHVYCLSRLSTLILLRVT